MQKLYIVKECSVMKYGIFFAIVEQIVPPISAIDIIYDENAARAALKKYARSVRKNCDFDSTFDFLVVFIAPCEREFDNTDEPAAFADPADYVWNFDDLTENIIIR